MKRIHLIVVGLLLSACGSTSEDVSPIDSKPNPNPDIQAIYDPVTSSNINELLEISSSRTVVLDVGATWCGACQSIKPLIKAKAKKDNGKWVLGLIDGDQSFDLVQKYKVKEYPTLISIKNGKEVSRKGLNDWESWIDSQVEQ